MRHYHLILAFIILTIAACSTGKPREKIISNLQQVKLPSESKELDIVINEIIDTSRDTFITISGIISGNEDPPLIVLKSESGEFVFNSFIDEEKPEGSFSALIQKRDLPTGTYNIGVAYNTDTKKALTYTGSYIYNFSAHSGTPPSISDDIRYNVEFIRDSMDRFFIGGWAFINNSPAANSKITVFLISPEKMLAFGAQMIKRIDITSHFGPVPNIDNSGFSIVANKNEIGTGNYRIGLQIENDGKNSFVLTDKVLSIPKRRTFNVPAQPTGNINSNIDIANIRGNKIVVSGWAFLKDIETKSTVTWVVFRSPKSTNMFSTSRAYRPDVAKAFKGTGINTDSSGFELSMDRNLLDTTGTFELFLFLENNEKLVQGFALGHKTLQVDER